MVRIKQGYSIWVWRHLRCPLRNEISILYVSTSISVSTPVLLKSTKSVQLLKLLIPPLHSRDLLSQKVNSSLTHLNDAWILGSYAHLRKEVPDTLTNIPSISPSIFQTLFPFYGWLSKQSSRSHSWLHNERIQGPAASKKLKQNSKVEKNKITPIMIRSS